MQGQPQEEQQIGEMRFIDNYSTFEFYTSKKNANSKISTLSFGIS